MESPEEQRKAGIRRLLVFGPLLLIPCVIGLTAVNYYAGGTWQAYALGVLSPVGLWVFWLVVTYFRPLSTFSTSDGEHR